MYYFHFKSAFFTYIRIGTAQGYQDYSFFKIRRMTGSFFTPMAK
ncbi:hypothetical protein METP1_02946 [Methanosarcinales archaeon]|nr:hypothetical protein METP1_02946 [Methanosarcinales archaeon]